MLACETVLIAESASVMIHNPSGGVYGGAATIVAFGKYLEDQQKFYTRAYSERMNVSDAQMKKMLDAGGRG